MDLSEAMKLALAKSHSQAQAAAAAAAAAAAIASSSGRPGDTGGSGGGAGAVGSAHGSQADPATVAAAAGAGYVTEKLYMLLQLYLQNKGWSPSVELLQCFAELKDTPVLPSAAYLQVLASRVALDGQGRLVLRESGKIILPFEHFANAVMLKHMSGPHGLHLSVEATVRAVMDSYTIGRENLGMEKEFIVEVVQSCPSPACRYYKGQLGVGPFIDQSFNPPAPPPPQHPAHINPSEYLAHLQQLGQQGLDIDAAVKSISNQVKMSKSSSVAAQQQQQQQQQHQREQQHQQQQQQITAALLQQQNRAIAQQSLEKFGSLSNLEKQRVLQQIDKKHFAEVAAAAAAAQQSSQQAMTGLSVSQLQVQGNNSHSVGGVSSGVSSSQQQQAVAAAQALLHQQQQQQQQQVQALQEATRAQQITSNHITQQQQQQSMQQQQQQHVQNQSQQAMHNITQQPPLQTVNMDTGHKLSDYMRGAVDPLENVSTSSKELLALHSGAWSSQDGRTGADGLPISQDKIIRAFGELMRNIARMKTFIRPSMCKPYGKQSESLQKTLFDTIQLVQSLRNCLPAPHIPVTSWKSETHNGLNGTEG